MRWKPNTQTSRPMPRSVLTLQNRGLPFEVVKSSYKAFAFNVAVTAIRKLGWIWVSHASIVCVLQIGSKWRGHDCTVLSCVACPTCLMEAEIQIESCSDGFICLSGSCVSRKQFSAIFCCHFKHNWWKLGTCLWCWLLTTLSNEDFTNLIIFSASFFSARQCQSTNDWAASIVSVLTLSYWCW